MNLGQKIQNLQKKRIAALTAYDYPTARILDEAGVDFILVGDSLGMVFAGNKDTTSVTMDQMVYHTEVVSRGVTNALLVSDLPYHAYESVEQALENSQRLLNAGAEAVKMEGGQAVIAQVQAIVEKEILVVGHIGMLPQQVKEVNGYKKWGKTAEEAEHLLKDALVLEEAGAIAIVLESIVPDVAREISERLRIPTIGIGAGSDCDGQISVTHDLIGFFPWFCPPFARPKADMAGTLKQAAESYIKEIRNI
ncbi:MAG: 3-methyl-2-oxobutanoate hydroxymethyltransferase [Verrucomicrobiota bacterium]